MNEPYFLVILRDEFGRRQKANKAYSLRAFAKSIEIDASVFAAVLKGKRRIPKAKVLKVADRLSLSPSKRHLFVESLKPRSVLGMAPLPSHYEQVLNEESHYQVISQWEHYAIIALTQTKGFKSDSSWIANKLGLTKVQAEVAIDRLLKCGLLSRSSKGLLASVLQFNTTSNIPSQALKEAHKQNLDLAKTSLEKHSVDERYFASETFAMPTTKMKEAQALIKDFRLKFTALLESKDSDQVVQLNVQFFPLTEKGSNV